MSATPPRKARIILMTLLVGFLSGATATSYVLLRYGYLIGFQRSSQTSQVLQQTPRRILQAPSQTQEYTPVETQTSETTSQAETQPQQDGWIPDQTIQTMPQTETQAQQLNTVQSNPASLHPVQEIQQQIRVVPHPIDLPTSGVEGIPSGHGAVRPTVSEPPSVMSRAVDELRKRNLLLPLGGLRREDLADSFSEWRGNHVHEAIDILAPRNTPILAVEDGSIARLWHSALGGITIYQFDPEKKYEYYYAHLERYADRLKEGDHVVRGEVIGYVGTSGNAPKDTPHLHFTIFKLTESKRWWEGTAINPFLVFR